MKQAIIGAQFGDEGKGITTSFLCMNKSPDNTIVIRSNGGHQAGHTVVYNGFRHVFSQFGSGTLQGIPTYISKFCTLYPNSFVREYEYIKEYHPIVYVDPMTMITTPWDIDRNRADEVIKRHGSVGMGFGQTIQRNEDFYHLFYQDLLFPTVLRAKIVNICINYYKYHCSSNILKKETDEFMKQCSKFVAITRMVNWDLVSKRENLIFESAQGILLDQEFGFFPNVTRSHTTSKNILELCPELDEIYYVTRTYQTRHGNGFMSNEDKPTPVLKNNKNETNKSHAYQGEFRISSLDFDLVQYALLSDNNYSSRVQSKHLIITCNDQLDIDEQALLLKLEMKCSINDVYKSYGPEAKTIKRI